MIQHSEAANNRIPEIPEYVSKDMVFERFNVKNMKELQDLYEARDQILMKHGGWDYKNQTLVTNEIKELLERIDFKTLSEEDHKILEDIIHFWYHHAISSAIFRYKDFEQAKKFADMAISMEEGREFFTTKLLSLLSEHKLDEAKTFATKMPYDQETAQSLIQQYEQLINQ